MSRLYTSPGTVRRIEKLLAEGRRPAEIIRILGVHHGTITRIAKGLHHHQGERPAKPRPKPRKGQVKRTWSPPTPDPTPEEIEAACAEIRRRRVEEREHYSFPVLAQL